MPTLEDDKVIIEVTKFASFQTVVGITDLDDLPDGTTFGRVLNTQLTGNKISSLGLGSSPGSTPITVDTFGLTTVGNAPNPAGSGWTARGLDHISVQESTVATGIWGLLGGTDFGVWIGKGGIGGGAYAGRTIDLNSVGIDLLAAKSLNVKAAGSINFEAGGSILADNNADIPITVSGTGKVDITDQALSIGGADYTFPAAVGAASTVLTTDGSNPGVLSWSTFSGVANPLTSNLDVATFSIVSTAGRDLTLDTDGVGTLIFTKGEAQSHQIQFVSTALSAQEVQMRFQNFSTGTTLTDGGLIALDAATSNFIIRNQETGGSDLNLQVNGSGSDINLSNLGAFQTDVIILAIASQESRLVLAPSNSTSTDKNFQFLTAFASDQLSIGSSTNPNIIKIINTGTVTFTPPTAVTGVVLDQDNDAITLKIDSESTTTKVISIESATVSGTVLDITGINSITTGSGITFSSTSMTTGVGVNVSVTTSTYSGNGAIVGGISGASATGTAIRAQHFGTGASLTCQHNSVAGQALFIDQNTNETSIEIDSEATTFPIINLTLATLTTGSFLSCVSMNSLTTGSAIRADTANASFSSAFGLGSFLINNASATGIGVRVQNLGTGDAEFLDQDGDGKALNIDSEATTATTVQIASATANSVIDINVTSTGASILDLGSNNTLTTGSGFQFSSTSLTTGRAINVVSSVSVFTSELILASVTGASSTGSAIFASHSGTGTALIARNSSTGLIFECLDSATTVFKVDGNGGATTIGGDLILDDASNQAFTIQQNTANNILGFQGQTAGSQAQYRFFSKDGDGTDNVSLNIFGIGTPGSATNRERLILGSNLSVQFEISTEAAGTGTILPLVIFTEGNTDQLKLETDGDVLIGVGEVQIENGVLRLGETTTPSADTNFGKIYTKTDNKIFFQDGAGVEHEIAFV